MTDENGTHAREHGVIEARLDEHDRRLHHMQQVASRMMVVATGAVLTTIGTVVAALLIGGINVLGG